ncbi:serine/threonine-protein phosphatase 4 regulatory subunit 4-like [Haemaphysalis longicornis]
MVPVNRSPPPERTCQSPPLVHAAEDNSCRFSADYDSPPGVQKAPQEGTSLVQLLDGGTLLSQSFAQSLLQSILSSVESRDPVVANAWADTLLDVLELLPRATIVQQVVPVAVRKGRAAQSTLSRLVSCRLMGALAGLLEPTLVQRELLPLAAALCQDPEPNVRICACRQLGALTRSVGLAVTKIHLLPHLVELSTDANHAVRRTALEATVTMLALLDDEPCRDTLMSVVLQWRHRSVTELAGLAAQIGPLCHLPPGIADKDGWLVELYRDLSTTGLAEAMGCVEETTPSSHSAVVECRVICASYFPDVLRFVGAESFEAQLLPTWRSLCADPDTSVRAAMSKGVSQVVSELIEQRVKGWTSLLHPEACELLAMGLLADSLGTIAQALAACRSQCCSDGCTECCTEDQLSQLVSSAEVGVERLGLKWRQEAAVWRALGFLAKPVLPNAALWRRVTQLLLRRAQASGPLPCRHAAVHSLLDFLQCSTRRREQLLEDVVRELAEGRSCRSRLMFVHLCTLCLEEARLLLRWRLLKHLKRLADEDPVENVRRGASHCLGRLKLSLKTAQPSPNSKAPSNTRSGAEVAAVCGLGRPSPEKLQAPRGSLSAAHCLGGTAEKDTSSPLQRKAGGPSSTMQQERSIPPLWNGSPSRIPVLDPHYRCKKTETKGTPSKEEPS